MTVRKPSGSVLSGKAFLSLMRLSFLGLGVSPGLWWQDYKQWDTSFYTTLIPSCPRELKFAKSKVIVCTIVL